MNKKTETPQKRKFVAWPLVLMFILTLVLCGIAFFIMNSGMKQVYHSPANINIGLNQEDENAFNNTTGAEVVEKSNGDLEQSESTEENNQTENDNASIANEKPVEQLQPSLPTISVEESKVLQTKQIAPIDPTSKGKQPANNNKQSDLDYLF